LELDDFLDCLKASGRSKLHIDGMRRRLRRFLEYTNGDISPKTVRSFFTLLDCSPKTRLHYFRAVKQFLKFYGLEWVMNGISPPKVPKNEPPIVSVEDVISDLNRLGAVSRVRASLLAYSGLREWEAGRLEWVDFDFERCRVHVRAEVAKDREERFTFIPCFFKSDLEGLKAKRYKPLEVYTLQHDMRRRGCKLTPKMFRKFFIQRLELLGVPRGVVKRIVGHRPSDIYEAHYFSVSWEDVEKFYRKIEGEILPY